MRQVLVVMAMCGMAATVTAAPENEAAFARIAALAGTWEGTYVWSGASHGGGRVTAVYALTGNGSAVVETLTMEGARPDSASMSSVYHRDGADLRMTHYCAAQNQPRLKATAIDLANGHIAFGFVDITNLATPDAAYMNGLDLQFADADHFTLTFHSTRAGQASHEQLTLARRRASANGPGRVSR